jgi:hypothetical protein
VRGFKNLKGLGVDKIFKGRLKVYKGRSKAKIGFIRDVDLRAYIGSWDYYVPTPVIRSLEKGVTIKEIINSTNIAKSGNSSFDEGLEGVARSGIHLEKTVQKRSVPRLWKKGEFISYVFICQGFNVC